MFSLSNAKVWYVNSNTIIDHLDSHYGLLFKISGYSFMSKKPLDTI